MSDPLIPTTTGHLDIKEVGPRDGFQMEPAFIPTETKIEIINQLSATGVRAIQVTSFSHPAAIPQLRDAELVAAGIQRVPGVTYSALVPNERGAMRALAVKIDNVEVVVSVSESHCLANSRMSTDDALEQARRVKTLCDSDNAECSIGLATALGCPFDGFPTYGKVEGLVGRAVEDLGFTAVSIADTAGMAGPWRVARMMSGLLSRFPTARFGLHLHNTRNLGLANVYAGIGVGVTRFDSAVAGIGGCPYAPGASGNIATEDLLNMMDGVAQDSRLGNGLLDAYVPVAEYVRDVTGHSESGVLRAGLSRRTLGAYSPGPRGA